MLTLNFNSVQMAAFKHKAIQNHIQLDAVLKKAGGSKGLSPKIWF